MKTQNTRTLGSLLLAATLLTVSGMAGAGKGNGGGPHGAGLSAGNSAIRGASPGSAYGSDSRDGTQYRYRHQYRHQNGKGNAWRQHSGANNGQYSDDRRLSQEDFQAWLNQNRNAQKHAETNGAQQPNRTRPGL